MNFLRITPSDSIVMAQTSVLIPAQLPLIEWNVLPLNDRVDRDLMKVTVTPRDY